MNNGKYGVETDIFSLGCIFLAIMKADSKNNKETIDSNITELIGEMIKESQFERPSMK